MSTVLFLDACPEQPEHGGKHSKHRNTSVLSLSAASKSSVEELTALKVSIYVLCAGPAGLQRDP